MKKILLIEDNVQMRESLKLMLEMEGFAVMLAEEGREGAKLALEAYPDLILCDVMMPELDGYGVLQSLRQNVKTATIPFIFLTAKGEKMDLRAGMNLGADDYLVKPVGREDVLAAIAARLQRQQQQTDRTLEELSRATNAPDFTSYKPLEAFGLSPREAEVLLWVAQGKNNVEIGIILGVSRNTVKKHVGSVLEVLGVEGRNAAAIMALEVLSAPRIQPRQ